MFAKYDWNYCLKISLIHLCFHKMWCFCKLVYFMYVSSHYAHFCMHQKSFINPGVAQLVRDHRVVSLSPSFSPFPLHLGPKHIKKSFMFPPFCIFLNIFIFSKDVFSLKLCVSCYDTFIVNM